MQELHNNLHVQNQVNLHSIQDDRPVAHIGNHTVKIGANPPIELQKVGTADIPFLGFRKATRMNAEIEGMKNAGKSILENLQRQDGTMDTMELLKQLNTFDAYERKYIKTCGKAPAAIANLPAELMAPSVQSLRNDQLTAVYGALCGNEMADLKEALEYEARQGTDTAHFCMTALSNLMDLEALVVSEASRRFAVSQMAEDAAAVSVPSLTESHHDTDGAHDIDHTVVEQRGKDDKAAVSMATAMETMAASSIKAEECMEMYRADTAPCMQGGAPELKKIGDYLRAQELTLNMPSAVLFGTDRQTRRIGMDENLFPASSPDFQLKNAYMLKGEGKAQNDIYMNSRTASEDLLFPFLEGDFEGTHRPQYAALNLKQLPSGACGSYGGAVLVLKPHVKQNATYTSGDSMDTPVLKFSPDKEEAFIKQLKKHSDIFENDFNDKLNDSASQLRKLIHDIFASGKSIQMGKLSDLPLLKELNTQVARAAYAKAQGKDIWLLRHCMLSAGLQTDAQQMPGASFDHIENLLGNLSQGDQLRLAMNTQAQQKGLVFRGCAYIEAQVHQPIDLNRDVAEIRISSDELPRKKALRDQAMAALQSWGQKHGIKVSVFTFRDLDRAVIDMNINQDNIKKQVVDAMAPQIRQDIAKYVELVKADADIAERFLDAQKDKNTLLEFLGDTPLLGGTYAGKTFAKLFQELAHIHATDDNLPFTPETAQDDTKRILDNALATKANLIREMADHADVYQFDTIEQKRAFTKWVVESKALKNKAEMQMLYESSRQMMALLAKVADKSLAPEQLSDALKTLSDAIDKKTLEYKKSLPEGTEFGPDDVNTEFNRTVFLGIAMFKNAGKPLPENVFKTLADALHQPEFILYRQTLDAFMEFAFRLKSNEDAASADLKGIMQSEAHPENFLNEIGKINLNTMFIQLLDQNISREASTSQYKGNTLKLDDIGAQPRSLVAKQYPVIANYANLEHPCTIK